MNTTKTLSIAAVAVGAILLGGALIPTVACGCLPAEESFLHLLREPEAKRIRARLIERESLLERQPLGTLYDVFMRDRGVLSRLKPYAQCSSRARDTEIECVVRTEVSWFDAVERYKRVRFQFGPDSKLNNVTVDSYVRILGRTFDG